MDQYEHVKFNNVKRDFLYHKYVLCTDWKNQGLVLRPETFFSEVVINARVFCAV